MIAYKKNTKERIALHIPNTELIIPATVICGAKEGKTITISAGIHSREYVGVQASTLLAEKLNAQLIHGRVILLHACNYEGLIKRSADIVPADGKNLNRLFPGNINGSPSERLAAYLEKEIISISDYLIDLHSGGFCESLVPHVYFQGTASKGVSDVSKEIAQHMDMQYIVKSSSVDGFYGYAGQCGVPAVILERGGCGLWNEHMVKEDINDVENVLRFVKILCDGIDAENRNPILIEKGFYLDSPVSGCWHPFKNAGEGFYAGEKLGEIRDIYGDMLAHVNAEVDGVVLYETVSLGIEKGMPMIAYGMV